MNNIIHEHIGRSIIKAITFRMFVLVSDFLIIFFITHRYDLTLGVLLFSNAASTILYIIHERAWNMIYWGRHRINHTKSQL